MPGGDYWKFLDATAETIKTEDIFLFYIDKILESISDKELKIKMKKKLFNLAMENGIYFANMNKNIFNSDEMKQLLEREFNNTIINYIVNEETVKKYIYDVQKFIYLLEKTNDNEWNYTMITRILDRIINFPSKVELVKIIESENKHTEIYNKLINNYYNYLPDIYKNFLKMKQDEYYIYNKSLKFINEDIGIDPRINIGVEIEANNDYEIHIDPYRQKGFEEYTVYTDASVPNGSEVSTTKPFHNTKEDVAKFCGLCEAMKDMGYYYSEPSRNASGQINLGLDYLDTKEAILNFYEIYGNCEELLYYICNEEGQLFRQEVYSNSCIKAISEIIGKRVLNEDSSREDIIELFNIKLNLYDNTNRIEKLIYKKNSVCLRGNCEEDYRLEFRIPNGGCNYTTWIDNIRLFGKIMEVSKKLADCIKKDCLSNEEEELLNIKIDLQDKNLSLENKLFLLMNLLFKDNNIKQIYYNRYISTIKKIEETHTDKYIKRPSYHDPSFDEVEFTEQYHSRFEPDYSGEGVIEYDPEIGIIEKNRHI